MLVREMVRFRGFESDVDVDMDDKGCGGGGVGEPPVG